MDSIEFTKIAAALLLALLLIFGFKTIVETRTASGPITAGYTLPAGEATPAAPAKDAAAEAPKDAAAAPAKDGAAEPAKDAAAAPADGGGDVTALLAKANADNGKTIFNKCKSCHANEKGKPNGVGPNLWGVVNRPKGSAEGFKYSDAMKAKGGDWSFAELSHFLANPKTFIPGTKMVFAGLPSPSDEADLIAYLATLADTPVALPK